MKASFYIFLTLFASACGSMNRTKNIQQPQVDSVKVNLESIRLDTVSLQMPLEELVLVDKNKKPESSVSPQQSPSQTKPVKKKKKSNQNGSQQKTSDKNGQLIYSLPDTMKVGLNHRVVVRIINGLVSPNISENLEHASDVILIRTSSTMQVEMIDANKAFSITSSNSQIQIVDSIEYTEWIFDVKPIKAGRHPLNIVSSIITTDGRKDKTYSHTVYVKMNIVSQSKSFWQEEWKWVFSTLIIPLIAWWYKNRKKKDASQV